MGSPRIDINDGGQGAAGCIVQNAFEWSYILLYRGDKRLNLSTERAAFSLVFVLTRVL